MPIYVEMRRDTVLVLVGTISWIESVVVTACAVGLMVLDTVLWAIVLQLLLIKPEELGLPIQVPPHIWVLPTFTSILVQLSLLL